MRHIVAIFLILIIYIPVHSSECDSLKVIDKKETVNRVTVIILLGITIAASVTCLELLTPSDPAPNATLHGFSEKQKIAIGCTGIGISIAIPFESIFIVKSFKKSHEISDSLEIKCKK